MGKRPYFNMLPMQAAVHMIQNPNPIKYLEETENVMCDAEIREFLKLCFHKDANYRATARDLLNHSLFRNIK